MQVSAAPGEADKGDWLTLLTGVGGQLGAPSLGPASVPVISGQHWRVPGRGEMSLSTIYPTGVKKQQLGQGGGF